MQTLTDLLRLALYVFVVAYLTSLMTYTMSWLEPDRPFSASYVAGVVWVGTVAAGALGLIEYSVRVKPRSGPFFFVLALLVLGYTHHVISSFTSADVGESKCHHSFAFVAHTTSDLATEMLKKREFPGVEFTTWRRKEASEMMNLTADLGIHERHAHHVARLVSTYEMLEYVYTTPMDWIVVLEDDAKAMPNFMNRLRNAMCRHTDTDVLWLQGPAILRWTLTGGIVDGTTALVYKRASIPRVLRWIEIDGESMEYRRRQRGDADEDADLVSVDRLVSDGCWLGKFSCGVEPLVVESKHRDPHNSSKP